MATVIGLNELLSPVGGDYLHIVDVSASNYDKKVAVAILGTAIKLDDLGAPDDNTDLNASSSKHGLLPKLSDNSDDLLTGKGTWVDARAGIQIILGDGVSAITTGVKGFVEVPFDCTIKANRVVADASGSIVIDIWKDTYANFPPTVADTITASAKPTLSSAQKSEDATLTGWTVDLSRGDWLGFNVDSATTVKQVTLSLTLERR